MMLRVPTKVVFGILIAAVLLLPTEVMACPVCYGESDSAMAQGINNGILALLAVVGGVQVAFVALFWNLRKRAKRLSTTGREAGENPISSQ